MKKAGISIITKNLTKIYIKNQNINAISIFNRIPNQYGLLGRMAQANQHLLIL